MRKYILVIIFILSIVGVVVYKISNYSRIENGTNNLDNEYVVDPSDMYKTEDVGVFADKLILTEAEKNWLVFMREEEKLARDVYTTLGDKWGMKIFSNIASSEQTHTDAVKNLLTKYKVGDPVKDDTVGIFTSPIIQKLYDELIQEGSRSTLSALEVGATIEDLDINDLDKAMLETLNSDILQVYKNLQKGSRNHMRAFVRNIESIGGTYKPKYISQDLYVDIVSTQQEKGRI